MKVTPQCVVGMTWVLKDATGDVLDELDEPVAFLVGGTDLLPAIEQALQGLGAGQSTDVLMEPHDAFGDYDENRVFLEPRALFHKDIEEGVLLDELPAGCSAEAPRELLYTVTGVYPDHVVLDGNHPLAGFALKLRVKVHAVRDASLEEIGAGSLGVGFFKLGPSIGPEPHVHLH